MLALWSCRHDPSHPHLPTQAVLPGITVKHHENVCKKKSLSQTEIIPAGGGETRDDNPEQHVHTQREHENKRVHTEGTF